MEFTNARYVRPDNSMIDIELNHPRHGWIPYTVMKSDNPSLWAEVVASGPAPYQAP
jgi:hypothetical protein